MKDMLFSFLLTASVFKVEGFDATSINTTLNPFCRQNALYTVQVSFGVRQRNSNDTCHPEQNIIAAIVPGESEILSVDTTTLVLEDDQEYCSTNAPLTGEIATLECIVVLFI